MKKILDGIDLMHGTFQLSPDVNQHHLATIPWRKRHRIDSSLNFMRFVREKVFGYETYY
jgi:hypothetical protein